MVHYFKKALLGLIFLFSLTSLQATVVLVQNLNDSGAGSLRDIITNANPGDTILMNVKGTINLTSGSIAVNKGLTILGAFPVHSVINCSGLASLQSAFDINGTGGAILTIQGFKITGKAGGGQAVLIQGNSQVKLIDCLFEGNNGSASGQVIGSFLTGGLLEIYNCGFFSNSSINSGGALMISSGQTFIRNCTFSLNNSTTISEGGAIYNSSGSASVTNCTFFNNNATNGADIYNAAGGAVELINNIFSNPAPSTQLANFGTWISPGGNVFSGGGAGQYGGASINGPSTIFMGSQAGIQIASTPITDGYGLKYLRIDQQTSPCVDNGISGTFLLQTDCKRAPRILYGDNALLPDAGAVEFTPFTVTSNTNGVGGFVSVWNTMNGTAFPGPRYMDFNFAGTGNYSITATLDNSGLSAGNDWIVDGYTHGGSAIPGPGTVPTAVTPAVIQVNALSSNADMMLLMNAGGNSWISGLGLDNAGTFNTAITCDDASFRLFGNQIISTNSAPDPAKSGIITLGVSDSRIGGERHHMRNVISGHGIGIYQQSQHLLIQGNFIGTNNVGTLADGNQIGIRQESGTCDVLGKFGFPSMNLISGNTIGHFAAFTGSFFNVFGNIIGPDYAISNSLSAGAAGVTAMFNTDGFIGNGGPLNFNVIAGNIEGCHIEGANSVTILGNYIGFSPFGTMPAIPNQAGINLINNGDATHLIGDGTFKGRNYISGNSGNGINGNATSGHIIRGNFIGLKPDNSILANNGSGIFINNASDNFTIANNVISGNSFNGIRYSGAGNNDIIQFNLIGTDSTGLINRANFSDGIFIDNPATGISVLDNKIAFNGVNGIIVKPGAVNIGILRNIIFSNANLGISLNNNSPLLNDPGDVDGTASAGNNGRNYPDNINVSICAGNVVASGILDNDVAGDYVIQVFKLTAVDPSGHGEGDEFVFETTLTLPAGPSPINITLPPTILLGDILSFTSSWFNGTNYSTSEFSDTAIVRGGFTPSATVVSNVTCSGFSNGVGTVSISGGVGPFSYQWYNSGAVPSGTGQTMNTFNADSYYCDITDIGAGCTITSNVITISEPPAISVSSVTTNVNCAGASTGGIDISVLGGVGGFTYDWDNDGTGDFDDPEDLTNIPSGNYSVVVMDANACTTPANVYTINEPSPISVTLVVTGEVCDGANNGIISLIASGGVGGYQYQLNGGGYGPGSNFSGLADGNYPYDVQDANGCIVSGNATVAPGEVVNANFTFNNGCEDAFAINVTDASSAPSGISGWSYTFAGASPSGASIPNVSNIMFFTPGLNNISLTVTSVNGCTGVSSQNVTIFPKPLVDVGLDAGICVGGTFTHNATVTGGTPGFTYSWNPASSFVSPTIEDPTVTTSVTNTAGSYTHILTVTDVNGCTNADTMILSVNNPPTVIAPTDFPVCLGSSAILTGSGTAVTYTWDNSVSDGVSFVPASTLTYTVTGTDAFGCSATDQVIVTVDTPPTVNAGADIDECSNTAFAASLNGTVTGAVAVNWTSTGFGTFSPSSSLASNNYFYTGAEISSGSVTLTLTASSGNSCPDVVDQLTVNFHTPPTVNAGPDFNVCSSANTVTLSGTATNNISVDWTGGTGSFSPTSTTPSTNYILGAGDISAGFVNLTLTANALNAVCADAVDDVLITILTSPVANAGLDASICNGQSFTLDGTGSTGSISTFQWDQVGGGFIASTSTANVSPTSTTSYALTTDNGTCLDYDTVTVTVVAAPDASFNYSTTAFCQNSPNEIPSNILTTGGTFSFPAAPININASTGEITFGSLAPGVYTIYYTLNSPCFAIDSVLINVFGIPNVTVNGPAYGCTNSSAQDLNSLFTPPTSGGTWTGPGVTDPMFDPTSTGAGSFAAMYTFTDSNGCTNSDTATIIVYAAPVVSISGVASAYCQSDAPFTPIGTPSGGDWVLNSVNVGTSVSVDPSTLPTGINSLAYYYTDPITGCSVTSVPPATFNIFAVPLDPTTTSPLTQTVCAGSTVNLVAANPNTMGGTSLAWYADATLTSQISTGPSFTTPPLTVSTSYFVVVQNAGCQSNYIQFDIIVNNAQVSAGPDITICPGTQAQLNVASASGSIAWSPGSTLSDSTIQNPIATPNVNTLYVVTVLNGPCIDSDSVMVYLDGSNPNCGLSPSYNAFSPDNDGVNDFWFIDAVIFHPDNTVTIYNRWGDKLIVLDDYDNVNVVWDGMYNGSLLPSGTYFYVIEYHDINEQVNGWVQLTR